MRVFMLFINIIYWLWACLVPTVVLGLIGFLLYNHSKENLPYAILLTAIGLVLGICWAERIRKKHGIGHFFSRIMATPEMDKEDAPEEKRDRISNQIEK